MLVIPTTDFTLFNYVNSLRSMLIHLGLSQHSPGCFQASIRRLQSHKCVQQ